MRTRSLTLAVTLLCWIFASPSSKAEENPSSASASKPAPAPYDAKFMKRAIAIAQTANTVPGTDPFGAVVVKDGVIIGEGLSAMRANSDATAHGEVLAIRAANKKLGTPDLSGCVLYTSCEPCPLCVAAIAIARLDKVFYAATLKESAEAFSALPPGGRFGVDVPKIIAEEHATIDTRQLPAQQEMAAEAVEVMKKWAIQRRDALLK